MSNYKVFVENRDVHLPRYYMDTDDPNITKEILKIFKSTDSSNRLEVSLTSRLMDLQGLEHRINTYFSTHMIDKLIDDSVILKHIECTLGDQKIGLINAVLPELENMRNELNLCHREFNCLTLDNGSICIIGALMAFLEAHDRLEVYLFENAHYFMTLRFIPFLKQIKKRS